MSRIGTGAIIFILSLIPALAPGQDAEPGHARSPDAVVSEIRQELGIGPEERVDPSRVPPGLLEELGDAVMGVMIGDEDRHEWMDRRMGGEGSERLASIHRSIGYRFLAEGERIDEDWYGPGMMGWGGHMGGWMHDGWWGTRGWGSWGWAGPVLMIGFWILVIAGIVLLVRWMVRQGHTSGGGGGRENTALDILKQRYARGELTEEEYRRIRKDLEEDDRKRGYG